MAPAIKHPIQNPISIAPPTRKDATATTTANFSRKFFTSTPRRLDAEFFNVLGDIDRRCTCG